MNLKEPSLDFRFFLDLVVKDSKELAEKGHSTGAFTADASVMSLAYQTITGRDPFSPIIPIKPDVVLAWAKDTIGILPKFKPCVEPSEDLIQMIQIMAIALDKAVNLTGASFPFVAGLLVAMGRAYYVVSGLDLLGNIKFEEAEKRLIHWAWSFRVIERQTKVVL
jgi:hypothetical protein